MRGDLTLCMADEVEGMKTILLLPDASEEQIRLFCDTLNPILMKERAFLVTVVDIPEISEEDLKAIHEECDRMDEEDDREMERQGASAWVESND